MPPLTTPTPPHNTDTDRIVLEKLRHLARTDIYGGIAVIAAKFYSDYSIAHMFYSVKSFSVCFYGCENDE